jgi:carbamoyl-phosphate synthase large subunit
MRFLVTAGGAGPSVSVIKAIQRHPLTETAFVVGVDMSMDSAGCHLADASALVPAADDPDYADAVLDVARRHDVDMVIPILDLEVPVLGSRSSDFESRGIHVAVDPPQVTTTALDKRRAAERCDEASILQPERWEAPEHIPTDRYPIIGKPVRGTGSRGSIVLESAGALRPGVPREGIIWQQFVAGQEFSIDYWGDPAGALFVAVPRWRRRVRDGQMVFGETMDDQDLLDMARNVATAFQTTQVGCLQVMRDTDGALYFIELNPRYGTGVSLSIEAGIHFPYLQWLRAFRPEELSNTPMVYKSGLKMIRYWEEHYYQ